MSESLMLTLYSAAETVVWALIHSLWIGGLIAVAATVVLAAVRRANPQVKYAIACVSLGLIIPLSIATAIHNSASSAFTDATINGVPVAPTEQPRAEAVADQADIDIAYYSATGIEILRKSTPTSWIFLAWLMGVSSLSLYHIFGWRQANRLVHLGSQPVAKQWQERFSNLCQQLGFSQNIELLQSPFLKTPCVVGWIKPAVLLPVTVFTNLSASDLEMILAHELAHIRRHDVLLNYLQTSVETLFFFNPAVWWLSRQIRIERENICDDLAVDACGDRIGYARALANLEALRAPQPHLALAADGTTLLQRVRRLVDAPGKRNRWQGFSLISSLAVVTILAAGLSLVTVFTPASVTAETDDVYSEQSDDIHGDWEIEQDDVDWPTLTIRFRRDAQSSFPIDEGLLIGLSEGKNVQFKMIRDAGTFYFEGDIARDEDGLWGNGVCHFRADPDYVRQMDELGYRIKSERKSLELAVLNVELSFARGLADLGYDDLSLDRLIEMRIHRATPEYIRDLERLGYKNLNPERLVEMRIHRVTPEYIEELNKAGYDRMSPSKLVEMRIHRVDPDYIRRFKEIGYDNIDPSKLVEMSIHRVSPDYVAALQELGYKNIDPSTLIEMQIHRVDIELIRTLKELGYANLSTSKLVEMQIHRVDPYFIRSLQELGYTDVDPSDLVSMRIHDVTPQFIREMEERGYKNLSPDRLIEYKIHGYDRDYRRSDD